MAGYLYEQTNKTFTIHNLAKNWPHPVVANEIVYWTKPYWDLYNGDAPRDDQEKRISASYKRKQMVCAKRTANQFVVRKEGEVLYLYRWEDGCASVIFCDDESFGITLKKKGWIYRIRTGYRFMPGEKASEADAFKQRFAKEEI